MMRPGFSTSTLDTGSEYAKRGKSITLKKLKLYVLL